MTAPSDITISPASLTDGQVAGPPIRLPFVLLCHEGQRWCGWQRTANSKRQFTELLAERRHHAETCLGGLILATA